MDFGYEFLNLINKHKVKHSPMAADDTALGQNLHREREREVFERIKLDTADQTKSSQPQRRRGKEEEQAQGDGEQRVASRASAKFSDLPLSSASRSQPLPFHFYVRLLGEEAPVLSPVSQGIVPSLRLGPLVLSHASVSLKVSRVQMQRQSLLSSCNTAQQRASLLRRDATLFDTYRWGTLSWFGPSDPIITFCFLPSLKLGRIKFAA